MAFNWDDYPQAAAHPKESAGAFNWNDHPVVPGASLPQQPATSPVTAATTGIMDLGGFGPALGALGKTGMDAIAGNNGPLAGGSLDDLVDEYRSNRDALKSDFAKAAAAHPVISGAGKLAGTGAMLAAAGPAAMTPGGMAATGAALGVGGSSADLTKGEFGQAAKDAAMGAATNVVAGQTMEAAAPYVGKAVKAVSPYVAAPFKAVGKYLGNTAEDFAVKATGATAKQAENFADNTGRELLDRGIVNFGSSPADIAENANAAIEDSGKAIGDTLENKLEGTTVDRNSVIQYIRDKIASMSGDDSKTELVDQLEKKIKNISEQFKPGLTEETVDSSIPIAQSEQIKRGYQQNSNFLNPDVDKANKVVSNAYRQASEDAATEANPALANEFKADKETIGLLSPVRDAAERRAGTLNQSPNGGLLDVATAGVGHAMAGNPGAVAGVVAKKTLFPRLASMQAVSADKLGELVSAAPAVFGKFAKPLTDAAARGAVSLGATDYILQQTNPEYRAQREKALSGGGENE